MPPYSNLTLEEVIKELQNTTDWEKRRRLIQRLASLREPNALPFLLKLLDEEKDPYFRRWIVAGISKLYEEGKPAYEKMVELLKNDPDFLVRKWAAAALGNMRAKEAIPILLEVLQSEDEAEVRGQAATSLAKIYATGEEVESALLNLLFDGKTFIARSRAAEALGWVAGPNIIPQIEKAVQQELITPQTAKFCITRLKARHGML